MRFLMRISWDVEAGNAIIRSGKLGPVVQSIRGGIVVVNISTCRKYPLLPNPGS